MIWKRIIVFLSVFYSSLSFSQQISVSDFGAEAHGKGGNITVPITLNGCFAIDNEFRLYLSDASGSFANSTEIGSYKSFFTKYINGTIPSNTSAGSNYRLRVTSTNPVTSTETGNFSITSTDVVPVVNPLASNSNTINDSTFGRCQITSNQTLTLQQTVPAGYTLGAVVKDGAGNTLSPNINASQISFVMVPGNYYSVTIKLKNNTDNSISSKSFLVLATFNNLSLQTSGASDICLPDIKGYTINITGNGGIKNNYPGTQYSIEWGDGVIDHYTHCELIAREGELLHEYKNTSCGRPPIYDLNPVQYNAYRVNVRATHTFCPNSFTAITTYSKVWQKPIADFVNPLYWCVNKPVTFKNTSQSGLSGYNNVVNCIDEAEYEWYVDGVLVLNAPKDLTYTFTTTGYHTVRLVASNDPCSDEETKQICIEDALEPNFKINGQDSLTGCAPFTVNISNTSTFGNGFFCRTPKLKWEVLLRSSMTPAILGTHYTIQPHDSASSPTFQFLVPGEYFIRLSAGNSCGTSFKDLPVTITDIAGVDFTFTDRKYCGTKTINFETDPNHRPTYNSNKGAEVYSWTITGGSYSYIGGTSNTSKFPQIKFNDFATYTVSIQFTNSCGTKTASQQITFYAPVSTTILKDTTLCNSTTDIQLSATNSGPVSNGLWTIIKGSGSFSNALLPNSKYIFSNADRNDGTVILKYTVNPAAGSVCDPSSGEVTITLTPRNVITSASAKSICTGSSVNYAPSSLTGSTYTWTSTIISGNVRGNTASGSGKINDVLTNLSATTNGVVKYTITPSVNGCSGEKFELVVTVIPLPDLAVSPTTDNICSGSSTDISLSSSYSSTVYKWTAVLSSGSATGFKDQAIPVATNKINQTIINTGTVNAVITYTITAVASDTSGCEGETKTVKVIVKPGASIANAGPDQLLCNSTSAILKGNQPEIGVGTWKQVGGPTSTIVNPNNFNTIVTGLTGNNTYTYVWVIAGIGNCPSSTDTVLIINRPAITPAKAGDSIVVCDFTAPGLINLNGNVNATRPFEKGLWTIASQPLKGEATLSSANSATSTLSFKAIGTYKLVWTITNDANCTPTKDTLVINVFEKPVAGTITGNTNICVGNDVTITLAGYTGSIKKWQYNVAPINDNIWKDTLVTSSTINFLSVSDSFAVRVIVASPGAAFGCTSADTSNVLVINAAPGTIPGTTGVADSVCSGNNNGAITLTGNTGAIVRWESSTNNGTTWTPINNTAATISYNNLTATTYFRAIVRSGNCGDIASSATIITVLPAVTKALVGYDQLICSTTTTLEGNAPSKVEKGKWTQLSGPNNAILTRDTSAIVNVSSLIPGVYKFVWTLSNARCTPTSDTIQVTVRPAITKANAGDSIIVCDFVSTGSVNLRANSDPTRPTETYLWSIISQPTGGKGTFSNTSNPSAAFSFSAAGTYKLLWTISNDAGCNPSKDTVVIVVFDKPVAGPITSIADFCGVGDVPVTLTSYTGNIKKWQYNPAPINDNIWRDTIVTNPSIIFVNAKDTFAVRVIVESAGLELGCTSTDTSNTLVINITPATQPGTTGPSDSVCYYNNNGTVSLTGNVGKVVRWEYSEDKGSTWVAINDTTNSITYSNLIKTTWFRAVIQSGNCGNISSGITIITVVDEVTKANAGNDQLICISSVQLKGNAPLPYEVGEWRQISGPNTATLSSTTTPVITAYNLVAGRYNFIWKISNSACPPTFDTVTIDVRPLITQANAGNDTTICDFITTATLRLNANKNAARPFEALQWKIISQPVGGNARFSDLSDPNALFTFEVAGVYKLEWLISNDAGCAPTKDTVVINVFEKPIAGPITAIAEMCIGGDVSVKMGAFKGEIKKWQYNPAPLNDNIWIDTLVKTSTLNFYNVKDSFSVRVIVESKGTAMGCYFTDTSNTITVVVTPGTKPGITGPSNTVCKGVNNGTISLTDYNGKILRWEYLEKNTFVWKVISDTTNSITYKNLLLSTSFRAIVENGSCGAAQSEITTITVLDNVTLAQAGPDQSHCAVTTISLKGNIVMQGETVSWSQIKGAPATFSATNVPNVTVSNLAPGFYSFVYTVTNSACPANTDTVDVIINAVIVNEIDTTTRNICSGQVVTITGKTITGGTGQYQYQWQSSVNGFTWNNIPGETNENISIIPTGSIYLRRLVSSLPCTSVSASVRIIVQAPIANNKISRDQNICINTPAALLNGTLPTGATGVYVYEWQQSIDSGRTWTTIVNATEQNYDPGVLTVTTSFRRNVTSGYCVGAQANTSNIVTVIVNPNAKAYYTFSNDVNCPPFKIDSTNIKTTLFDGNDTYLWYVNNKLVGTDHFFPGYTIASGNDSAVIRLITVNKFGCKDDTMQHTFYTKITAAQPAFAPSVAEDCGPLTVSFTNQTPNASLFNYKWNFGNGRTSTLANPGEVIFRTNPNYGDTVYRVSLTVYSECDSITTYQNIRVKSPAQALFKPDRTVGCSPMTVTFTNYSEGADDFTWNFGDGTIVNTKETGSIKHTFISAVQDTFRVQLIARSACGSDTQYYSIVISPNKIRLILTVNGDQKAGCSPHTVQLINNSKGASSFRWEFGDGNVLTTTKNIDTVTHTYTTAGTYIVKLFASNGCSDTATTETIKVYSKPVVDFSALPATVCIGDTIRFTNLTDTTTGLTWSFGDGNFSNLTNPKYSYKAAGVYNVTLIGLRQYASGSACIDSASKTVTIVASLPGSFSVSDSVGNCTPFTITFTNNNRPSVSTVWDFGDGTKGSGDVVKHTYLTTGNFTVTMTAIHPGGCKYVDSKNIVINGAKGSFTYEGGVRCDNTPVRFEATTTGADSLRWIFGDGTILSTTSKVVYHSYKTPGIYIPSVELIANASCRNLLKGADTIKVDLIKAGFTQSFLANCGNTDVTFKDTSKAFSGIASSTWNFGDTKTGAGAVVTHNYATSNTWMVKLISTSRFGCSDTTLKPVVVSLKEMPVVSIINDTSACANKRITYNSSVVSKDTVTSYRWSFSNGVNNTGVAANNVYSAGGVYNATLIVSTINGCLDTATSTIKINPAPFVTATPDQTICIGESVQLNASGGISYSWGPFTNLSCLNCSSPVANPTKTTKYTVTALNGFGCASQDTVVINVSEPFKMQKLNNDTLCLGQSIQLYATGADKYKWSPAFGLSNSDIANPIATPGITTRYRVIGTDSKSCFADTAYITVAVGKNPTINLGADQVLSAGTLLPLNSIVTNGPITKWEWYPSKDLSCNNCPLPTANIKKDITYSVKATNAYGCSATDTMSIKVFCQNTQVFIPNLFTPDGDGVNDILMVRGSGINSVKSFRIFNRWGEVVFDKANFPPNDKSSGWDGTIRGAKAPTDVYVYTCEVVCENGSSFVYKGNVAIIK